MKNLIELLKTKGVGFVTGNYRSYYGFSDMRNVEIMSVTLSADNEAIEECLLFIESVGLYGNRVIHGMICDKTGEPICPLEGYGDPVSITLNPFTGINEDIGTFIAKGPWGIPEEYKPE